MKFDYLLNFTISGLVEIGSKCFTHCTKDRVYLQLVFYGERESRNFESFFFFACSIAKAKWFACSIKAWFFATSIYNFLAITSGEGHVESMVFPRTLWPEKRKIIYNN